MSILALYNPAVFAHARSQDSGYLGFPTKLKGAKSVAEVQTKFDTFFEDYHTTLSAQLAALPGLDVITSLIYNKLQAITVHGTDASLVDFTKIHDRVTALEGGGTHNISAADLQGAEARTHDAVTRSLQSRVAGLVEPNSRRPSTRQ